MSFLQRLRIYFFIALVVLGGVGIFLFVSSKQTVKSTKENQHPDVYLPTIVNGELVLPTKDKMNPDQNLGNIINDGKLSVNSANLVGVFEGSKLSGIRIIGELTNIGQKIVHDVSPVVRFIDKTGRQTGQKIARYSTTYFFHDLPVGEKTMYDVVVDSPPESERVEVIFNVVSSTESAQFETMKITNRNLEVKSTQVTGTTPDSTNSAELIDYYTSTGQIINPTEFPLTDIVVYTWVKNEEGRVFGAGQAEFKNDLVAPGQAVDYSMMVIPLQKGQKMFTYEVSAWGKVYKLNF